MAKQTQQQLVEEYFTHMVGKTIDGVAVNNADEIEITLQDDSIVIIWSSEDLSMLIDYPPKLN
jgi:phosphoserine aminotransferase